MKNENGKKEQKSYELESLSWLLDDNDTHEIDQSLRMIQLTYSELYIAYLELIAQNKMQIDRQPIRFTDSLMFIPNQLAFLKEVADAFEEVQTV